MRTGLKTLKLGRFPPFETGLLVSLLFHVVIWKVLTWKGDIDFAEDESRMEIDLTRPFRLTDNPLLARRAEISGTGKPVVTAPVPQPDVPKTEAKEWVLPTPETQEVVEPTTIEEPTGTGLGGLGDGSGEGEVDWIYLTDLPRILNANELKKNLRRFYPEAERRAGREGYVSLDIHINREGRVSGVDIAATAGPAFDEAARKVISIARFSPAKVGEKAVPVKIRQTIAFQLEE